MKNYVRFVFYNNQSIQKLAFFRFLECSLRKANNLFSAQIIWARQPTFSEMFFCYFFHIKHNVYARRYMLKAICNRKGRFPIQKHQKIQEIFPQFFQSKQTTESSVCSLTSSMCLSSYWSWLGTNQKARNLNVVVNTCTCTCNCCWTLCLTFFFC
jgi:hypothetical protein